MSKETQLQGLMENMLLMQIDQRQELLHSFIISLVEQKGTHIIHAHKEELTHRAWG